MDQAQVNRGKATKMLRGLQIHLRKGENACPSPCFNLRLNSWSPKKVRLFQVPRSFFRRWVVHVVASTVVLCAILAVFAISLNLVQQNVDERTIAERSRRTGYVFFYMFCILFSILYDSYESDPYRGEPFTPNSSAWRGFEGFLTLQFL